MLPSLKDLSDSSLLDNVKSFKKVEDVTIAELSRWKFDQPHSAPTSPLRVLRGMLRGAHFA